MVHHIVYFGQKEPVRQLFSSQEILSARAFAQTNRRTFQCSSLCARLRLVITAVICATGVLSAKEPLHPEPTPDPALELSPTQDAQIQRINNLFAQKEKPLSDALKKARQEYKRAINAHPVDNETVQEKSAALQKATTLLATAEALHRANVLILLTPAQRKMVATFELTGKIPGNPPKKKSTDTGN